MGSKEEKEREELLELVKQMRVETSLLERAVTELRDDYGKEYSNQAVRSELEEMIKLIQAMNTIVGEGESSDITTSEAQRED